MGACARHLVLALVLMAVWLARPISGSAQTDSLDPPIFDAHIHYNRDAWSVYSVDDVLALLDQAGVRKAFVSSTPDDGTLLLYERAPDVIVPALRPYRTPNDQLTWTRDDSILTYVQQRLEEADAPYRGIGEFHLLAGESTREVPVAFARLGAGRGLILHIHGDADALEQFLALRSDVTVLWAHAGMTASPARVQAVLDAHPNVWVELALRTDVAPGGRLDPNWAAVFAQYPDRFMIGTDTWIPSQWTRMSSLMADVRVWLRQLPPDLARAIAFDNADRLFGSAAQR
jgi:amidohydrolase family protein